jgi:undecaprenyl phosphate-alpha-L-ara4N flippase subunit ArnE
MPGFSWLYLLSGFAVFGIGAVLMILSYRHGELSVLQPINSVSYVFSLFLGYFIFHEIITFAKIIGVVIIISGVVLLGRGTNT